MSYSTALQQAVPTALDIYANLKHKLPEFDELPSEVQAALIQAAAMDCAAMCVCAALDDFAISLK